MLIIIHNGLANILITLRAHLFIHIPRERIHPLSSLAYIYIFCLKLCWHTPHSVCNVFVYCIVAAAVFRGVRKATILKPQGDISYLCVCLCVCASFKRLQVALSSAGVTHAKIKNISYTT